MRGLFKILIKNLFLLALPMLCASHLVYANNLSVSLGSDTLTNNSASADTIKVNVTVSWDNSWRNSVNRDAVWIFMKYSTDSGGTWSGHAQMQTAGTNPSGTSSGTGTALDIIVPTDKTGAFLERSATGFGTVSTTVQLVWDYAAAGLTDSQTTVRLKVFGLEMVYIPTGPFFIGDGNGTTESTYAFHGTDNYCTFIYWYDGSGGIDVSADSNANDDIDDANVTVGVTTGDGVESNPLWPTGYNDFYLMKYEITEGLWKEFFNNLTTAQKANRDITAASGKNTDTVLERNTIYWTSGTATTTYPMRACGYLSWMDVCAFADWAALRPMTETEYEKAARGARAVLDTDTVYYVLRNGVAPGEYAWGTTSITAITTVALSNTSLAEDGSETSATAGANCTYNTNTITSGSDVSYGPVRGGLFATGISGRQESGAGYYGNMELSGNLIERVVSIGNTTGRAFTGTHGDGVLTTTTSYEGNATNTTWPGIDGTPARGVTGATGSGSRGGGFRTAGTYCKISDRTTAAVTDTTRLNEGGGRAARTAP